MTTEEIIKAHGAAIAEVQARVKLLTQPSDGRVKCVECDGTGLVGMIKDNTTDCRPIAPDAEKPTITISEARKLALDTHAKAEAARAASYVEEKPQHVCGLSGYNGMIDPPCLGCEAEKKPPSIRELMKQHDLKVSSEESEARFSQVSPSPFAEDMKFSPAPPVPQPDAKAEVPTAEEIKVAMRVGMDAAKAHIAEIDTLKARVKELVGNIEHEQKACDTLQKDRDGCLNKILHEYNPILAAVQDVLIDKAGLDDFPSLVAGITTVVDQRDTLAKRVEQTQSQLEAVAADRAAVLTRFAEWRKTHWHKDDLEKMEKELAETKAELDRPIEGYLDNERTIGGKFSRRGDVAISHFLFLMKDKRQLEAELATLRSSRTGRIVEAAEALLAHWRHMYGQEDMCLIPQAKVLADACDLPAGPPSEPGAEGKKLLEMLEDFKGPLDSSEFSEKYQISDACFSGMLTAIIAQARLALASHPQPSQPEASK